MNRDDVIAGLAHEHSLSTETVEGILADLKRTRPPPYLKKQLVAAILAYQKANAKVVPIDTVLTKSGEPDRRYGPRSPSQPTKTRKRSRKNRYLVPPEYFSPQMAAIYVEKAEALEARNALTSESYHQVIRYAMTWAMYEDMTRAYAQGDEIDPELYGKLSVRLDALDKAMEGDAKSARTGVQVVRSRSDAEADALFG